MWARPWELLLDVLYASLRCPEGLEGSRLRAEQVRFQIALRVRQTYWRALAAQYLAVVFPKRYYFGQIFAYHEARFHEGKLAEVDLLRVRLEGERVHGAEARAQLESERALLDLEREMASPDRTDWKLTEPFEALDAPATAPPGTDPVLLRVEGQAAHQATRRTSLAPLPKATDSGTGVTPGKQRGTRWRWLQESADRQRTRRQR